MSGQWPPDWEDPDDGHADAGLPDEERPDSGQSDHELSELTSFLASVHSPALPASFEARISAAIAAEAAARAATGPDAAPEPAGASTTDAGAGDAKDTVRSANPEEVSEAAAAAGGTPTSATRRRRRGSRASQNAAGASGPGTSRPDTRRRRLRIPSTQAAGWVLLCCLVLAGFGFLVSRGSSSSSSSEAASSASNQAPSAATGGVGQAGNASGSEARPDQGAAEPASGAPAGFLVYSTGTAYERSTLASQVRGRLVSYAFGSLTPNASGTAPGATAAPAESASASSASSAASGGSVPSPRLSGCVSRVTDGATPSLVDKASYDGIPAYIIAVPTRVWVVRTGCSAADTELIVQAPLTG